jgi:single-strand DNA-binding protein
MLKAQLVGNIGTEPEMRYTAAGQSLLTFSVASNYRTKNQAGEWVDKAEWVRVTVFGKRAETLSQYLHKGSRVFVDGRLEARPWENRDGQPGAGLEITANEVEFMSGRHDEDQRQAPVVAGNRASAQGNQDDGSDVPF